MLASQAAVLATVQLGKCHQAQCVTMLAPNSSIKNTFEMIACISDYIDSCDFERLARSARIPFQSAGLSMLTQFSANAPEKATEGGSSM